MFLKKYLANFGRLIYPNNCAGCGSELHSSTNLLCWLCLKELPKTGFENHVVNPSATIFYGRLALEYSFSLLFYNKGSLTQHLVHQIKYKRNLALGHYMGKMMGQSMLEAGHYNDIDVLVPLPLNKKKLLKRGYNQALVLCEGMAEVLNKPIENVAIMRKKYTETQTRKTRIERWNNVGDGVFDLDDNFEILKNKHVLLVDDVITTGATMEACGQELKKVPGLKLSMASLAIASKL